MRVLRAAVLLAGSLIGWGCAALAADADWSRAEPVEIELSNFAFKPADLHLRQGHAYRLHFVNRGSGGHNFSAPAFFSAARIAPGDTAGLTNGKVELDKGAARDIRLVPAVGSYKVKCTHFLHSGFGMKGKITVE